MKKIDLILKKVLEKITPSKEEMLSMESFVREFKKKIEKRIKELKIKADVFIGGSYAKKTMIKSKIYDVDFFIRFHDKGKNISDLTEKILKGFKKIEIKGSRNYFVVDRGNFLIEIIPVLKVNNPRKAENVTDLSYSHVNYIRKKANGKILDEIKLAKAFCRANNCYGAESYIKGFSGYAIELLVCYYGSFLRFIKSFEKIKEKTAIDIEKQFKNKNEIFMDLNESKIHSPVVLIDPTCKSRNALAALSHETFEKFKKACSDFLRKPDEKSFEMKIFDTEKMKTRAKNKKQDFVILKIKTDRQNGDIAGTKLLKFYNHLTIEIEKNFNIKEKHFAYNGKKNADCFFSVERKKEVICSGPLMKQEENAGKFKKKHKNIFVKSGRIYAREKVKESLEGFLRNWEKKYKEKIREMGIVEMEIC